MKLSKNDVVKLIKPVASSRFYKGITGVVNRVDGDNVNVFIKGYHVGVWFDSSLLKKIGGMGGEK